MNNLSLMRSLYDIGAIKFGEFVLKSGQTSKIYWDLRQIISYPTILKEVSEAIWQLVSKCQFDMLCGVPYTAMPIATCLSLQKNIPMVMRRKEKKAHGTKQQIEGAFESGQSCLIIDDVITTGGSILETVEDLEWVGLKVHDVVTLINREQGGNEALKEKGLRLHSVFTLNELMKALADSTTLTNQEKNIVLELI